MRIITKTHLSRRTFIRGMGVTMALPFLESMVPAQTPLARTAANPQIRLGMCFIPHSAVIANRAPSQDGTLKRSRTHLQLNHKHAHDVLISTQPYQMSR